MTGEMSYGNITKGGEDYEWAQHLKFASLRLMRMTKRHIMFKSIRPYDKYQGPYAQLNHGRLWSGETDRTFFFEGMDGITRQGTLREIADTINSFFPQNKVDKQ